MFKSLSQFANLAKQAQQISGRLQEIEQQLKNQRATGAAGGGMVQVEVNGLGEVLSVKIEPALMERGEREMIEDLLPSAINQAQTKAKQLHAEAMQSMTQDLDLPSLGDAFSQFSGK